MTDKEKKKFEVMRKFISVLPEENLAKILRAMIAEEQQEKPPRRLPTPPQK